MKLRQMLSVLLLCFLIVQPCTTALARPVESVRALEQGDDEYTDTEPTMFYVMDAATESPIAGAIVEYSSGQVSPGSCITNADGGCALPLAQAGDVTATVSADGYLAQALVLEGTQASAAALTPQDAIEGEWLAVNGDVEAGTQVNTEVSSTGDQTGEMTITVAVPGVMAAQGAMGGTVLTLPDGILSMEAGMPVVPMLSRTFDLPTGAVIDSIKLVEDVQTSLDYQSPDIYTPLTLTADGLMQAEISAQALTEMYPSEFYDVQILDAYKRANGQVTVTVWPVQYSAQQGALAVHNQVTLSIQFHTEWDLDEENIGAMNDIPGVVKSWSADAPNIGIDPPDGEAPQVTLDYPNGGQSWVGGSTHTITWTATDNKEVKRIELRYSTNGGSSWNNINTNLSNTGSYNWVVPSTATTTARVKVTAYDAAGNNASDQSDSNFTITTTSDAVNPSVTVLAPNGGENWEVGTPHNITWTASDNVGVTNIKLYYSTNGGSSWYTIDSSEPNDGSYTWTVPNAPSTSARVRVIAYDAAGNSKSDTSNANFTIKAATTTGEVLLVDDDDNYPDVRGEYEQILLNLGITYDVWNTGNSDNEPDTATLNAYDKVIWFTGDEYGGYAGPGSDGESALSSYLNSGGCLFLSSQDYLWDHGHTSFGVNYLGIDSYRSDVHQFIITGTGTIFGTIGDYQYLYGSMNNFTDEITPTASANVAVIGDMGVAAISKQTSTYKTTFWAFPLELLYSNNPRQNAIFEFLNWCDPISMSDNVVINEVDMGYSDSLELYNKGSKPVDLTGWQIISTRSSDIATGTIPSAILPPYSYMVVHEAFGYNTITDLYLDDNIWWTMGGDPGSVALVDDSGTGVDFARWGSSTDAPPSGTSWTGTNPATPESGVLGRNPSSTDTNNSSDWCDQGATLGMKNRACGSPPDLVILSASDGDYEDGIFNYWNTVPGATRYELFRSNQVGAPKTFMTSTSNNYYLDTTVRAGYYYYYWLRVCNNNGCSAFAYNQGWRATTDATVLISEVYPGYPDAIELYNASYSAVDMTGWSFDTYYDTGNYTFTTFILDPGSYVVLIEGTGTDTANTKYTGNNIDLVHSGGEVVLYDGTHTPVDFVSWGWGSTTPPTGTEWNGSLPALPDYSYVLGRKDNAYDTDWSYDWFIQPLSMWADNTTPLVFLPIDLRSY